jgi:hypothetical protein
MRVPPRCLSLAAVRALTSRALARSNGQLLHSPDLDRHGLDVLRMAGGRAAQLQCFPLAVKKLMQLAQRRAACRRKARLFLYCLPLRLDSGNHLDHFVGCGICSQGGAPDCAIGTNGFRGSSIFDGHCPAARLGALCANAHTGRSLLPVFAGLVAYQAADRCAVHVLLPLCRFLSESDLMRPSIPPSRTVPAKVPR